MSRIYVSDGEKPWGFPRSCDWALGAGRFRMRTRALGNGAAEIFGMVISVLKRLQGLV